MVVRKANTQTAKVAPEVEEDSSKKELGIRTINTANDTYDVKIPTGPLGGKHFMLLTKAMPKNSLAAEGIDSPGMSPADQERLQEVFVDWIEQVLPEFAVKSYNHPELKPEEVYGIIPGEDQWVLYLAAFKLMNVSGELFRVIS